MHPGTNIVAMAASALAPADRAKFLDMQETSTSQFITTMTKIIRTLHDKNKKNPDFNEVYSKYMAGKDVAPTAIITGAAQSIYGFRNEITSRDESWLLEYNFVPAFARADAAPDTDKLEFLGRLISQARNVWRGLSPAERTEMWDWLASLLSATCTYAFASNKLGVTIIAKDQ